MSPGVTPPRYIVEDQLVFVTCGAVGRSFRFLPVEAVVRFLWFALAATVRKYGIAVHEVFFLSNHFHIVLTDVDGCLPDFMRDLNSLVSRGLNALREAIERGLKVMDSTALSLCMDNDLPIYVFNMADELNIDRIVSGETVGTLVSNGTDA